MNPNPETARRFGAVARLGKDVQRMADHVVARACAAHRFGGRAEAYRANAQELDRQADNAERLLFGQATKTFRSAAAENRLIADAMEVLGSQQGMQCRLPDGRR